MEKIRAIDEGLSREMSEMTSVTSLHLSTPLYSGTKTRHCVIRSSISYCLSYRSISSSSRRCPDVSAKLIPVLRHSACCCHRTKRICGAFLPYLSWLYSAFFPATIPCIIAFSKPLWRVTWPKYFSC